jgi:hypothetical protein
LKRLDKAIDYKEPDAENQKYDYSLSQKIIGELSFRLEFVRPEHANKEIRKQIVRLTEGIEELNRRFENHRHPKDRTYSDKPVY